MKNGIVEVNWSELRRYAKEHGLPLSKTVDKRGDYHVWVSDGVVIGAIVSNDTDKEDVDNNVAASKQMQRDSDGYPVVRTQDAIHGSGPWFKSKNMADTDKTDWPDAANNVCLRIIPSAGKKLILKSTKMIHSADVSLAAPDQSAIFTGFQDGDEYFARPYGDLWDYVENCDDMKELSWGSMIFWAYSPPIVLRSSLGQSLDLILPDGPFNGTRASLKIKAVSLDDHET